MKTPMRVPNRLEILNHFKRAKTIKCLSTGNIIDLEKHFQDIDIYETSTFFDLNDSVNKNNETGEINTLIWEWQKGYAEIIETTKNMIFRKRNYFLAYFIPKKLRCSLIAAAFLMVFTLGIGLIGIKPSITNYIGLYVICFLYFKYVINGLWIMY